MRWVLPLLVACGGSVPETRFYELAPPTPVELRGDTTIAIQTFDTDSAYDDERIVYRTNPYRLDYYQYHRWAAAPGVLVGNYLERALEHSGRFHAVVRGGDAPLQLGGRVIAIEEVDATTTRWVGRIALELTLTDTRTGDVVWSEQIEETEPMPMQKPEGLARALSTALGRVADKIAPAIEHAAAKQVASRRSGKSTSR